MSYNKLFYNAVTFGLVDNKIVVELNFLCPVYNNRPTFKKLDNYTINPNRPIDFRGEISVILPCCGLEITLNVAVHKEKDELPNVCFAIPGHIIRDNWWVSTR